MKKGLKQKISLLLIMAMVITMSMPVSARENRSVFDDTPIIEELSSDHTVIGEEPAPVNLQASGSVIIDTARDVVDGDREGEPNNNDAEEPGWVINNLGTGAPATSTDYNPDYSVTETTNTDTGIVIVSITINNKETNNENGLELKLIRSTANEALNLTWADGSEVPVTFSVDSSGENGFTGIGTINVISDPTDKTIKSGTGTTAVVKHPYTSDVGSPGDPTPPPDYEYVGTDGIQANKAFRVFVTPASEVTPLTGDAVTVDSTGESPDLLFKAQAGQSVSGVAAISKTADGIFYDLNSATWKAEDSGTAVVIYGNDTGITAMRKLTYKTMGVEGYAEFPLSLSASNSSSISGTLQSQAVDSTRYFEAAAVTVVREGGGAAGTPSPGETAGSIVPFSIAAGQTTGSFTVTGLTAGNEYFVRTRIVKDNSSTRYQIYSDDNTLYIPSYWIAMEGPTTTSAAVTNYDVIVDQTSLNGSSGYASGSISDSFSENDTEFAFTGIPADTEQYTFDGWQYRFADEAATVRHDVTPDAQGKYVIDVTGKDQNLYLYAKWLEKLTSVTIRMNDQEADTASISNEITKTETASLTTDCAVVKIELVLQTADAQETLTVEPDGTGFFGMGLTAEDARKQVFAGEKLSLPYTAPGQDGKQIRTFYVAAAKSGFNDTPMNKWKEEGRRSGAVKLSVKNDANKVGECTVCIDGYDAEAEGYYENGALVKSTAASTVSRQVAGKTVNFDTEGVRISALTVEPAIQYLPVGGAEAALEADGSEDDIIWNAPTATGENELFRSATAGKSQDSNKACMNIVTGTVAGSYTFTAQEKNFPVSSAKAATNAQSVVSIFGISGTVTGSATPAFGIKDTVAPGKWNTTLNYSKGADGTISADTMTLTLSGGDLNGAPQTGTITLTSSDEKVVTTDSSTLTQTAAGTSALKLTAAGPGTATVTLIYNNTEAAQNAKATVTLTLDVTVEGTSEDPKPDLPSIEVNNGGFSIVGLNKEYPFAGTAIRPVFKVVDNATGTTLANGTDYTVSFSQNSKVGTAKVKVKGKGNYNKSNAEASFEIVDPRKGVAEADVASLKGAKITAINPNAFNYDGEAHFPESITLKLKGGSEVTYTGVDGKNYVDANGKALPAVVTFANNVNKGSATVLLSGKDGSNGKATKVKKTFKIKAIDLYAASNDDLTVTVDETVEWAAKGAQPEVKVIYKGRELRLGQDFKVKYTKNKKIGTANVAISGSGNYAKSRKEAAKFTIVPFDLSKADIIATTAVAGVKVTKVKATILDKAGNAIPAGKLHVTVEGAADAKLAAGETVTVNASAYGAELKESCTEEVTVRETNLKNAKIKVGVKKTYTGEEITLGDEDMKKVTVTLDGTPLVYGEDFEIVGYTNNIKKGTMTVTVSGKGDKVSGTKTFKVKIEAKPMGK